jgi:polyhydroxybutyrate depolymerase
MPPSRPSSSARISGIGALSPLLPACVLILVASCVGACAAWSGAPGDYVFSVPRPEGARTFRVHVPASYASRAAPFPLLLAFHGLNDHCETFDNKTGFVQLSEAAKFLLVYPCSTSGPLGPAWNAGRCCLQPTIVDDEAFALAIVDDMQSKFDVDSKRLWAAGFANGAMFSAALACDASYVFAAIGVVSGTTELLPGNEGGLLQCDKNFGLAQRLVNVLHVHGNLDLIVPWNGSQQLGFPDTPTDMQRWASRNACSGAPVQTFANGSFSNQVWQNCSAGVRVELVKNDLGGHHWVRNADFDTSAYMLQYFAQATRPPGSE